MKQVTIRIDYPKNFGRLYGMNRLYSGLHWSARKEAADFWHNAVAAQLRRQKVPSQLFNSPVELFFRWNDRLDLSNEAWAAKMIEDALKGRLIFDDSKRWVKGIHHQIHDKRCIELTVREAGE